MPSGSTRASVVEPSPPRTTAIMPAIASPSAASRLPSRRSRPSRALAAAIIAGYV